MWDRHIVKEDKKIMRLVDKNTNNLFDFLKGLACIGVVLIHVSFPGIFGQVIARLSACAVPLFIMISGYYAYGCEADTIRKRLKKSCIILLYGLCVFFVIECNNQLITNNFVSWIGSLISWKAIIKLVVFCTIDFGIPLWYLVAMIETYLLWYFAVKKSKEMLAIRVLPLILVLQVVSISICDSLGVEWFYKINFITRALAWFVLGYFIHKNSDEKGIIIKSRNICICIGVILGGIIAVLPLVVNTAIDFSSLGLLIYSSSIFMLGVKNPKKKISTIIEYIGRELSLNVYILHVGVMWLIVTIMSHAFDIIINEWLKPILVVILSILFAFVINIGRKKLSAKK